MLRTVGCQEVGGKLTTSVRLQTQDGKVRLEPVAELETSSADPRDQSIRDLTLGAQGEDHGGAVQRGGFGGGQRQQQQRPGETPSPQQLREWYSQRGGSGGGGTCPYVIRTGDRTGQTCGRFHTAQRCFFRLVVAWCEQFPDATELPRWADLLRKNIDIFALDFDAILGAMYALTISVEGECYLSVPPDPGIGTSETAAPGASASAALGPGEAAALGTRASTALDPGEAAALGASKSAPPGASASALAGTASTEALHTFTLGSGASRCFFRDPTALEQLTRPVAVSLADPSRGPVLATSSTVLPCPAVPSGTLLGLYLPSFSTNLVAGSALQDGGVHQFTPAYEHVTHCTCARTGRHLATFTRQPGSDLYTLTTESPQVAASASASVQRLRGTHSRYLVSGLPRVLPPLPPSHAPPCLPLVEGRQRAAPHPSSFPPTEVPLQTLHTDVWGPARVRGQGHERYFLLVVDDYTRYTTVFPLHTKGEVPDGLIPWIRAARLQLRDRFQSDFPVLRLHSYRGVQYTAHKLNLWPRVSAPETSPTLLWTGQVGDASRFRVWGACAFVRNTTADKLSDRAVPCVFLGFVPDAPGWQFYHPTLRRVFPSQDVTFDESRPPTVPGTHQLLLRLSTSPQRVPLPSPPASSLPTLADPESDSLRAASPTVPRLLATVVTNPSFESAVASALVTELVDFAAHCRLDYAASLVAESESVCPPSVGGECALGTDILEDRQEDLECFAAAVPHLVSMLIAPEGDPDAPDIPTSRSYAEAIAGEYSSQWVKRPPGSPPVFKARYVARGFSQREGVHYFKNFSPTPKMTTLRVLLHIAAQRDYELHSLDFSTAFLQGSLHEEVWLRRPPGFTGSFPPGTQWSLRRPVYGLRQAPREWHDTLRTTLAALGFLSSTADPSLFLLTDTSLLPFYILVYVDDLVFATADTEALAHVKSELQKRHTCTDLGPSALGFTWSSAQTTPLATGHSLSAPPSDESVEPSGPYPELVGCLMYLMTCTHPDLAYPLGLLARYVAPGRHRKVHMDAAKRVLRYLCSTSGMGLVLGGRRSVVLTGHSDASWVDDQATQRSSQGYTFSLGSGSVSWRSTRSSSVLSSSCEAEIYATAMAAQELRWLTYLLTDLGERPSSPPVLYVDNKAAIALCEEHRLEHRTKHIALRYFLARELQQRSQLRLRYVATRANTADIFTKAIQPGDHQRFCTILGLVPTFPHLL
ncbi:unnamed protein product [Closterium sp. NIES-53]